MGYFEEIRRTVFRIPAGKVATYGSVARAAGYPGTARQVAWALRASGPRGLPWQRVLGSGGKILLTGEDGIRQRVLLEIEGVRFKGCRVDMRICEHRFKEGRSRRNLRQPGATTARVSRCREKREAPNGG
jgi:methylated-DNA-protein-cysteine methyltransferase-like protein